jgi:1-deoxy-D-xylulose-5-phosphate synthase
MQRAYDQIIHDVALQNLNVVFCLDRAGIVGADGPTHHGAFDIAFMRSIPNMTIAAPMDEHELRNMMYTAQYKPSGPFSIRYPRGKAPGNNWHGPFELVPVGKARTIREGSDVAILTIGNTGNFVNEVADKILAHGIDYAHYDMRFVKPMDKELLLSVFRRFNKIVTIEDGVLQGGFGSAVLEFMADHNFTATVVRLGIPDKFVEHGASHELYEICGYSPDDICEAVVKLMQPTPDLHVAHGHRIKFLNAFHFLKQ